MRALWLTLSALAATNLCGGCVVAVGAAAAEGAIVAMQQRSFGEAIDDASARSEIRSRMLAADSSAFLAVHVESSAGNVLIWGNTPDEQHHQTAVMIARIVRSVRAVYDEIQVGDPRNLGRRTGDQWISTQIRARINASPHVRGIDVGIQTFRGNVYLMGVMRSQAEVQNAAEIASRVPGVQRVVSFMRTRDAEPSVYAGGDARGAQTAPAADR